MKIAIVDDDIQMYNQLKSYLNETLGTVCSIEYFKSGEDFLRVFKTNAFDVAVLDIFMDGLTGVDTAKEIRKTDPDVKIVFSTTSNEFASESYEVNACYYLLKPLSPDKVKIMLGRLDIAKIEKSRAVKLPDGTSVVLRNIIYTDCAAHRITIHCKKSGNIVLRTSFQTIESLLYPYSYFFSPTKGIIVNFYEVVSRIGDTFKMSDESIIPISRRKANEVLEAYSAFCFERLRKEDDD